MNIECPQCGSTEFTKLSVVYAEGFSDLEARSRGWGFLFGAGGAAIGFAGAQTKGRLQSRLSQAVAPPRKWSLWRVVMWSFVGFPFLAVLFVREMPWSIYGYPALMAFVLLLTLWHNYGIIPPRRRIWERSFMCRRCGHMVEVSAHDASPHPGAFSNLERKALR